jgi:hypothetical protein
VQVWPLLVCRNVLILIRVEMRPFHMIQILAYEHYRSKKTRTFQGAGLLPALFYQAGKGLRQHVSGLQGKPAHLALFLTGL